jgi:hypothetical protein
MPDEEFVAEAFGVRVQIVMSAGSDGAPIVFIDTDGLPENDVGPMLRVHLNDAYIWQGVHYEPSEES